MTDETSHEFDKLNTFSDVVFSNISLDMHKE